MSDNERCPRCGRKLGPRMVALLDRMEAGFVPTNALVHFQHAPLWGVLGRLSHHGLIRGEVDEANRRVNYVRCTPHPTDFRIWCIPKSGWPTVEPESDNG